MLVFLLWNSGGGNNMQKHFFFFVLKLYFCEVWRPEKKEMAKNKHWSAVFSGAAQEDIGQTYIHNFISNFMFIYIPEQAY